ncbi:MAG: hypothetical protein HGB02_04955 [Chlorobiaceae bacterium]|nr:hypothetical protein [Chlorobiaceae bacterium]
MNIPLNGFDEHIDETILKRGLSYFRKGNVLSFEETGPGEYEAIVAGTEDYTVRLTIQNRMVTEHTCNCPYDLGPFCKHEVAALFHLQQDDLGLKVKTASSQAARNAKTKKPKTITNRVNELLGKATAEELRNFLREHAAGSASFRNLLLASFAQHDAGESKAGYAKQVKSILRSACDRQGFVNWSAASHVGHAVIKLLTLARQRLQAAHWESAFFISTSVMEEMVAALQFADDSNGDIGSCIREACELMYDLARQHGSEERRRVILDYCLTSFDKGIYSGWDWEVDMLRISLILLVGKDEAERLSLRLDRWKGSDYRAEIGQKLRYELVAKTEGEAAADRYLFANLANPTFRRIAITKAFDVQQYEKARQIALEGVECDQKMHGLVIDWTEWLLKIAQATEDHVKVIEYARYLFIRSSRHEQDYYEVLKRQIGTEAWPLYLEELIRDIVEKNCFLAFEMVAGIFVRECMWNRLLELLGKSPSLDRIAQQESFLAKEYAAELIGLYGEGVIEYLRQHTGRNHYQTACRFLRRMNKLGGRKQVQALISSLRLEYSNRRALLEELEKV